MGKTKDEKRDYVYFISFVYDKGYDSVEVYLSEEIQNIDMIAGIANDIEKNLQINSVQVLNFVLLRVEGENSYE